MKKTITILALITLLYSCGNERPRFNSEDAPFIVSEIEKEPYTTYGQNMAKYYTKTNQENSDFFFRFDSYVYLPVGWYNVGDTIIFPNPRIKNDTIK